MVITAKNTNHLSDLINSFTKLRVKYNKHSNNVTLKTRTFFLEHKHDYDSKGLDS